MAMLKETLAVLGAGPAAAAITLREALRFKTRPGSLIVQDSTGRGATILSPLNQAALERRRVVWVDLADRRHPVSLFQIRRSAHARALWSRVLKDIAIVAKAPVGAGTLSWAAEAAYALSADGSVGLGALFRCLSSPETRRWFLETRNEPSGLGRLLDALAWALSFPSVHAVSEGENRGNLLAVIEEPSVIWLESPIEHFEPKEHLLVQVLVEAALEDALRTMASEAEHRGEVMHGLTVLHLYPAAAVASPLETWVSAHLGAVRHVGVHRLDPEASLSPHALDWVQSSEVLWIAGPAGTLRAGRHDQWLSNVEAGRLSALEKGELWVRSNASRKALVVRVRDCAVTPVIADHLRSRASRKRRTASLEQVAAAVTALASPAQTHRDLYERLSDAETLRSGWFRVRASRTHSTGVDGVSLASFAGQADIEIATLCKELQSGQYRSSPLRRIQIPKADGGVRNLGVACVRDRVVQAACLTLLEPIFEPGFSRFSYAFRPGRGAHHAVALARSMIATGRQWAVIADVRKCFDTIDHTVLLGLLAQKIADDEFLAVIHGWLTVDVLDFRDLVPSDVGVPQGESISPLLANVYLDPLDKHFERIGIAFVRYADDILMLAEDEQGAKDAYCRLADFLRDILRLELKPSKTGYVAVSQGFDFLGFRITETCINIKREKTDALIEYLSRLIAELGATANSTARTAELLARLNSVVRGWRNYFLLPGEAALERQLGELDARIEEIASFHLPRALKDNPAWLCRERLSVEHGDDVPEEAGPNRTRKPEAGPGYPDEQTAGIPEPDVHGNQRQAPVEAAKGTRVSGTPSSSGRPIPTAVTAALDGAERVYVLTHGSYVTVDGDELVLRKRGAEYYRRGLDKVGLVYLQGFGITASVEAQVRLAERDIAVVLSLPVGKPAAVVNPIETTRSAVRRLQAMRRDEPDVIRTGLGMIAAKIANQAAVLKYFAKYRKVTEPETAQAMMQSAGKMRELSESVLRLDAGEANVRGAAMGFEGHAAAIYWRQLAAVMPGDLGFGGRITQTAQDPVNQCLNYVYGVLYGEVWRAVVRAGLDPYFGLMHGSVRDQGSLVFDLIEEFRAPFGDRVIVGMLGRGFRPEIGRHGLLKTRSKELLVRSFTKRWARPIRYRSRQVAAVELLEMQAASLAAVFRREGNYHAYRMRW